MQAVADRAVPQKLGKIDVAKALALRFKNKLTYDDIGRHFGVTGEAVRQRFDRLLKVIGDPELVEAYDRNRADILTVVESELLQNLLDDRKLKDASINNIAYAFQQINNARRLERGESTVNQASLSVIANIDGDLDDVKAAISKLRGHSD